MDKKGRHTTLIKAFDDCGGDGKDCNFFFAVHEPGVDVKSGVRWAFRQWARTEDGRQFIESNGCNWGDALYIPGKFLPAGIHRLGSLMAGGAIRALRYDHEMVVDHDERLVDMGEVEKE